MHLSNKSLPNRKWLGEISYSSGKMVYPKLSSEKGSSETEKNKSNNHLLASQFQDAKKVVEAAELQCQLDHRIEDLSQSHQLLREDAEELRWFVYPDEAYLKLIDIDEGDMQFILNNNDETDPLHTTSTSTTQSKNNFHNVAWRERWLETCPLSPKYYPFHHQALNASLSESLTSSNASSSSSSLTSTSIAMPKTHRFTATVTDLNSALHAKSPFTAKQMDIDKEAKKKRENGGNNQHDQREGDQSTISTSTSSTSSTIASSSSSSSTPSIIDIPAAVAAVVAVVDSSSSSFIKSEDAEEAQERRLEEAIFQDDDEDLSHHKHEEGEEDDDGKGEEGNFCCPIPSNGTRSSCSTGVCPIPSSSSSQSNGGRTSVKTVIDQRKANKKQKKNSSSPSQSQSQSQSPMSLEEKFARDKKQSEVAMASRKASRLERYDPVEQIEHRIFKQMVAAIRLFDLIGPGDKVLVGVSGGKDSLTLLQMLLKAQKILPFKFEVGAVTVDPQTLEFDPSPLKVYMAEIGVKYFYDSQPLISIATDIGPSSICAWCSRMKRGILHNICEREGYNVLALGQHLDDLVESFFMYSFHNGKLDTMKSASVVRDGKLKIVRPFVFVREKDTKHYANLANLPVITENCPACFEEPKERARIKALLKAQERLYPNLFGNLLGAIKPLMHPDLHLDQILTQLDKDSKTSKNKKYYPKRRSDQEQAAYRDARAKAKLEAKQQKSQKKNGEESVVDEGVVVVESSSSSSSSATPSSQN
jgi:tRNA(Ile)-lysidine synthase TilS/MesJ